MPDAERIAFAQGRHILAARLEALQAELAEAKRAYLRVAEERDMLQAERDALARDLKTARANRIRRKAETKGKVGYGGRGDRAAELRSLNRASWRTTAPAVSAICAAHPTGPPAVSP
jgi:hypothetical protein